MANYRKLGRTSSQRKALIRNQVTSLLHNGKIVTTEAKAKEIRKVAEGLIAMAVRERDNFEEVTVTAKVARKDKDGKRVKEVVDGKKVTVYDEVEKTIKKDKPSRLHARREMLKVLYPVVVIPKQGAGDHEEHRDQRAAIEIMVEKGKIAGSIMALKVKQQHAQGANAFDKVNGFDLFFPHPEASLTAPFPW